MVLCRLIYSSQAIAGLAYPDLKDIMEKSEKNNLPVGISGMLCYGNKKFLQILEGERKTVSETYERILKDERHENSQLIEFVEIESRLFTNWSMKVVQLGEDFSENVKALCLKYSTSVELDTTQMTSKQCLEFLKELSALVATA